MRLIGMMDSPYVRRVAVSLKLMGLPFEHDQISVFSQIDAFGAINPVIKAPSLVTDQGVVLMDSTLILDYLHRMVPAPSRLMPEDPERYLRAQRVIGLALAACEKTVQIVYELNLRPIEHRYAAWLARVEGQLNAAYDLLETELSPQGQWLDGDGPMQADVTAAVAWRFTGLVHAAAIAAKPWPRLAALSARAEALPAFEACPL